MELAIRGHETRGKEVIEILKMLGGLNQNDYNGDCDNLCYYNCKGTNVIDHDSVDNCYDDENLLVFTLEEFLEKFPYKVGDNVSVCGHETKVHIEEMKWDGFEIQYSVFTDETECYSAEELNKYNKQYKEDIMENKMIDVAEILRKCPKGMKLNCIAFEDVYLDHVDEKSETIECYVQYPDYTEEVRFNKFGYMLFSKCGYDIWVKSSKCVIFPEGKLTWEGFIPSSPFKDGDIIFTGDTYSRDWCSIYKREVDGRIFTHANLCFADMKFSTIDHPLVTYDASRCRFASRKESEKLFKEIEENGYKWNSETKTLERLVRPKFKIGDKVITKGPGLKIPILITNIVGEFYFSNDKGMEKFFSIKDQDDYELISEEVEPKFKVGDEIRKDGYKHIISEVKDTHYILTDGSALPFTFQDEYELVPDKFDINTLVPFESRVLVRDSRDDIWKPAIFGCFAGKTPPYYVLGGIGWKYCIPYEGNEHLRGKKDDCSEHYKTWK